MFVFTNAIILILALSNSYHVFRIPLLYFIEHAFTFLLFRVNF